MTELRLEADDSRVLDLTLRALAAAAKNERPDLTIKCKACGMKLAYAGNTEHGPLFYSTWRVPIMSGVVLNGKRLTEREARKYLDGNVIFERGRQDFDEPHGALALLELPDDFADDYPDLMVRCTDHGDAVLQRQVVLAMLRESATGSRTRHVEVTMPWLEYRRPRQDTGREEDLGVKARRRRSVIVTHFGPKPSPEVE